MSSDQAAVRDGDAVGVARQIGEHRPGPGEWFLGVDDPLGLAQRLEEGVEGGAVGEGCVLAEEGEAAGTLKLGQSLEKQPPEQT
jgi:hypothetical protein